MRGPLRPCGPLGPRSAAPHPSVGRARGGRARPCRAPPSVPDGSDPHPPSHLRPGLCHSCPDPWRAGCPQTTSVPCPLTDAAARRRLLPGETAASPWGSPRWPASVCGPEQVSGRSWVPKWLLGPPATLCAWHKCLICVVLPDPVFVLVSL